MSRSNAVLYSLIHLFNQGGCYSGNELGIQLGMTRSAVWKYIQKLRQLGLDIQVVQGQGYQLVHPITLLNVPSIIQHWPDFLKEQVQIETKFSVDSTNDEIKKISTPLPIRLFISDHQKSGRGRQGRSWESPLGHNVYYSYGYWRERGSVALEGLSLVAGLALIETLKQFGISQLSLKWPNDVLWDYKKIAGILIEIVGEPNGNCQVVIGIGLNILLSSQQYHAISQMASDLYQITGQIIDKNKLVAELTIQLYSYLSQFERSGFGIFQKKWNACDAYHNQLITLKAGSVQYTGLGQGVNGTGHLQLLIQEQGLVCFSSGEITHSQITRSV